MKPRWNRTNAEVKTPESRGCEEVEVIRVREPLPFCPLSLFVYYIVYYRGFYSPTVSIEIPGRRWQIDFACFYTMNVSMLFGWSGKECLMVSILLSSDGIGLEIVGCMKILYTCYQLGRPFPEIILGRKVNGDWKSDADSCLSNMLKLEQHTPSSQTRFFSMVVEAYTLFVQAQVEMALGRFENAVSAAEKDGLIDYNNVEIAMLLNNVKMVARARTRGNRYDSSNSVLYCNRAVCWSKLGLWEKSVHSISEFCYPVLLSSSFALHVSASELFPFK
ncbi:TPR repeat-containing thioredoxin TTL1-like protein [Corchorus olitorius]|uniref:TPR repeat-containing thioredoxin TTL1-like protein n=1 Tax=Corchorus olitorius TaxID=93759 RepID=A0A1R3GDV2_9ROSI|nr:TPR repeat-containing thioredoxin TTL1-like protein [Corchorus olitorius]